MNWLLNAIETCLNEFIMVGRVWLCQYHWLVVELECLAHTDIGEILSWAFVI